MYGGFGQCTAGHPFRGALSALGALGLLKGVGCVGGSPTHTVSIV